MVVERVGAGGGEEGEGAKLQHCFPHVTAAQGTQLCYTSGLWSPGTDKWGWGKQGVLQFAIEVNQQSCMMKLGCAC